MAIVSSAHGDRSMNGTPGPSGGQARDEAEDRGVGGQIADRIQIGGYAMKYLASG